jgi:hypothetical protein
MIVSMPRYGWLAGSLTALVLAAAGCGGGDDEDRGALQSPTATAQPAEPDSTAEPEPTAEPDPDSESAPPDPADVRVVRAWADTLRRGEVRAAARYFALPSLVSNGTPPIKLETRAEAEFFNRTLPCGARLIDTEPAPRGFFIATFRLTERPGAGECGSGTGETARTAFRVRGDRITDWLRVQDIESAPETLS